MERKRQFANLLPRLPRLPERGTFAWIMMMMGIASIFLIIVPFTFWYVVWYGFAIDPVEIEQAFAEPLRTGGPETMMLRMSEKISRGDKAMRKWYPKIVSLSKNPSAEVRRAAAWTMGKDSTSNEFHEALKELLGDPLPVVRRSAAVSLSAFGDPAAREELRSMLEPFRVRSPVAGSVAYRVQPGDTANGATVVAKVGDSFVGSDVAGPVVRLSLKEGEIVSAGQVILEIAPEQREVMDALQALSLIGTMDDSKTIEECVAKVTENQNAVKREAEAAIRQIESRHRRRG